MPHPLYPSTPRGSEVDFFVTIVVMTPVSPSKYARNDPEVLARLAGDTTGKALSHALSHVLQGSTPCRGIFY